MKWREGQRVRATRTVTESGGQGREKSKFPKPSYIHARKGELGTIVGVDAGLDDAITVAFDRTGTATIVGDTEIEVVK